MIMNKIEISNPKIILINCIGTPPSSPGNSMIEISDSGANIYLSKQAVTTMDPVIMPNDMIQIIPDGRTMESSHIATLQIPVLSKQARQIHICPKMKNPH